MLLCLAAISASELLLHLGVDSSAEIMRVTWSHVLLTQEASTAISTRWKCRGSKSIKREQAPVGKFFSIICSYQVDLLLCHWPKEAMRIVQDSVLEETIAGMNMQGMSKKGTMIIML